MKIDSSLIVKCLPPRQQLQHKGLLGAQMRLSALPAISKLRSPLLLFSDLAENTTYKQKSRQLSVCLCSWESQPPAPHSGAPVPLPSPLLKAQDLGPPLPQTYCVIMYRLVHTINVCSVLSSDLCVHIRVPFITTQGANISITSKGFRLPLCCCFVCLCLW